MPLTPIQLTSLRRIAESSITTELSSRIPAELTAAQCIIESAWLKICPGNNCFGIKYYAGAYGRQLLLTREWFTDHERDYFLGLGDKRSAELVVDPSGNSTSNSAGRRQYRVYDWFAVFPDLTACFARRAALLQSTRYVSFQTAFLADRNLESYIQSLSKVYATDPAYADKLLAIIRMTEVQEALYDAKEALSPKAVKV